MTDPKVPTTAAEELKALRLIVAALEKVDRDTQDRIAGWVYDRYQMPPEEEMYERAY